MTSEQLIEMHPELSTRPNAVTAMAASRKLHASVINIIDALLGVATRLHGHPQAREVLTDLWNRRKQQFHSSWNGKLPKRVFAECYGALRNVYYNAIIRSGQKPGILRAKKRNQNRNIYRAVPEWVTQVSQH